MIGVIKGEIIKDVDFVQITYGKTIDFRNKKGDILYSTKLGEEMVFIHANDSK